MLSWSLVVASLLYQLANASPAHNYVVHETRNSEPAGWHKHVDIDRDSLVHFKIALAQTNLDRGHDELMKVADPSSESYGKHWSEDAVAKFFAPTTESINKVHNWLLDAGVTDVSGVSESKGFLKFKASIQQAEQLFKTEYALYEHAETNAIHLASMQYSLPKHIREHVDFVMPTVHFDAQPKKTRGSAKLKKRLLKPLGMPNGNNVAKPVIVPIPENQYPSFLPGLNQTIQQLSVAQCGSKITPACLHALYGIPYNTRSNAANSYGIVEYSPQAYIQSDLSSFFSNYTFIPPSTAPTLVSIDGGNVQNSVQSFDYNGESDLDLEYAIALVYPQQVTLYQTGDDVEGASFNNFLDALDGSYCAGDDPTQDGVYPDPLPGGYKGPETCGGVIRTNVVSTSYGYNEADLTPAYEQRQCNEYMKLGLLGTSFLYSSGDYGVGGNGGQCIDPVTGNYTDGTYGKFNPSFPGTCPYVTSVGATQIVPGGTVTQPEEACETVIYSGGGFSNVFPLPSYQSASVKSYFANHKPSYGADRYNNSMTTRGHPDISANGANYVVALDGTYALVYGTSASSPVVGSIITMLNQARLDVGKQPLGFLNPLLYANPSAFNDITSGGNQGCGTPGFTAVSGWDPVTGLGTPNYPKLLVVVLALP